MIHLFLTRVIAVTLLLIGAVGAVAAQLGRPLDLVLAEPAGIALGVRLDLLSGILLAFVASLSWLVARYSGRNLAGQRRTTRFGLLQLATLLSLAVLVTGASLPVVAAGWTLSGLTLAALVAHPGSVQATRAAAYVRRRFLVGDLALWTGVVLAVVLLPSVDRADLPGATIDPLAATIVGLVLLVACATRSALVPAHRWLPETAEGPSPVSALLHAGIVNGTAVLLTLFWPLVSGAPAVLGALVLIGTASVVVGTLAARARADVKGRLACSTTAQMGYMAVQLGLGLPAAAVLHLIGHGYYKSWLFLRAGGHVQRLRTAPGTTTATAAATTALTTAAMTATTALHRSPATLAAVVAACATTLILAGPTVVAALETIGPAALVPVLLTVAAVAVGATAAVRDRRTDRGTATAVVAALAVAGAGYLWLLEGTETFLAGSLPKEPVWSAAAATALVAGLAAAGVGLVAAVRLLGRPGVGRLDVLLATSAAAPWARRVRGVARLPRLGTGTGTDQAGQSSYSDQVQVLALVRAAARLVGPAWPTRSIVAANPLSGLEHEPFERATSRVGSRLGTSGVLPLSEYARLLDEGRIQRADLAAAVRQRAEDTRQDLGAGSAFVASPDAAEAPVGLATQVDELIHRARTAASGAGSPVPVLQTFCSAVDRPGGGSGAQDTATQHAALWTQRAWSSAVDDQRPGPWQLWRSYAVAPGHDRVLGLRGTAALVHDLPEDPAAALARLLGQAGVDSGAAGAYLESVLAAGPGWAAHAAWRARRLGSDQPLLELVALRVALDLLVAGTSTAEVPVRSWVVEACGGNDLDLHDRHTWQLAYELGYQDRLLATLAPAASELAAASEQEQDAPLPDAQLVMCIDVRSERLRRHLEATGPYATYGFAGFFGIDLELRADSGAGFEQCPALIRPSRTVTAASRTVGWRAGLASAVAATAAAPLTPLLLAEAGGVAAGVAAAARTAWPRGWGGLARAWAQDTGPFPHDSAELQLAADLPARVELAAGALRGMGLVDGFAPLLVLVGHATRMENNAFATAYDCGACGGNGGQVNAQVLASLLNEPDVRDGLAAQGVVLPDSTMAVAAVHVTTTDEVVLDPSVELPAAHRHPAERLQAALARAGTHVRAERRPTLPGPAARVRAEDWSQPCPEWGLAGNAALVIGPRALTGGRDLDGRVFLHSYDPCLDPGHDVLRTLLTAPLVVTQWINSQYYASTVDAGVLGAGDKTTHNVVGDVGVLTGAHGDLRLGLPWQSLFDADPVTGGRARRHEPLRLLAVVWADPEAVLAVVSQHEAVADLVRNGWVRVVVLDPADGTARRLTRTLGWAPCTPATQGEPLAA